MLTAGAKTVVTTGFLTTGTTMGAEAGLACGPLTDICVPAGATSGAWIGHELGGMLDEKFEKWGVWDWIHNLANRD
ncbi:hypothetical protein ACF08B_36050 [Streptomyces sp. NPDC015139]|uniref:hypothetical protein n=1 Tax=Streptomyces sp. NPDC015139 TaxID=3364942 RepID=UPI0036F81F2F